MGSKRRSAPPPRKPRARTTGHPPRRPDPPDESVRYARLLEKYQALVQKYQQANSNRFAATKLAFWTLRNRTSAVALVQDDAVVVTNGRWDELERVGRAGTWRPHPAVPGVHPEGYPSLRELAVAQARSIEAGAPSAQVRLFELTGQEEERYIEAYFDVPAMPADGTFVLIHDVTARVRAERENEAFRSAVRQREQMELLGKLASSIAHDFNNTFFALRLRLERLLDDAGPGEVREGLRELLEIVATDALRIRQLQDFAQRRTDQPAELVDLCAAVREAASMAQEHLRHDGFRHGVRFDLHLELPPTVAVSADRGELRSVLLNLLLNARDAMVRGGAIRVVVRSEPTTTILEIIDEGSGVAAEDMPRLFEPFFTTKKGRGTGLGLSTAKGMMTRIGGTISAENCATGGALFRLTFPAVRGATQPAAQRLRPVAGPQRRILVVDDQPSVLESMRLALQPHDVALSGTGREALARFERGERYDLVFCDLGLPDLDGFQVAAAIHARAPGLPVVLVTGWADELARNDPRREHVVEVLRKPLGVDQLNAAIERALHPLSASSR